MRCSRRLTHVLPCRVRVQHRQYLFSFINGWCVIKKHVLTTLIRIKFVWKEESRLQRSRHTTQPELRNLREREKASAIVVVIMSYRYLVYDVIQVESKTKSELLACQLVCSFFERRFNDETLFGHDQTREKACEFLR